MSSRFVHIIDDIPELRREGANGAGPVLIVALDGFLDAGNASALAAASLQSSSEGRVVASFDIEEFHDYRARRPAMTFHEDRYSDYEAPRLVVQLLRDELDQVYLLLNGPEPDMRWEAFAGAVAELVEQFGVRQVISLGSVPMAVPHSRPIQLTQHITREDQRVQDNVWSGEIRVPSSAQSLMEVRLGEWGHPAQGFVAHIPHYVAQFEYPEAAVALLRSVEDVSGLQWDHTDLIAAGEARQVEIATQLLENDDVRQVVAGLEQQYDAFHAGQGESLLAGENDLPTGEEIGAQFEQFLAGLDSDDPNSGRG